MLKKPGIYQTKTVFIITVEVPSKKPGIKITAGGGYFYL
jgi:hypothetical protein